MRKLLKKNYEQASFWMSHILPPTQLRAKQIQLVDNIRKNKQMKLLSNSFKAISPKGVRCWCTKKWLLLLGPGEQGAAVILSADEEKKKDALYKVNGFNAYASDKISLDRALKDIRHPE